MQFAIWFVSQVSFVQFYNPDFLRAFGDGVVNGSLWTIPVEMQFYILTPLLIVLFAKKRSLFYILLLVSLLFNNVHNMEIDKVFAGEYAHKLMAVTFLPWIYMFMLGALLNMYWHILERFFVGKFWIWLGLYSAAGALNFGFPIRIEGNAIILPWVLLISGLIMSAAFTNNKLAELCLRKNDISYGIYIYHMPIFNFAIQMGLLENIAWRWFWVLSVLVVAFTSWKIVEKPALRLKNYSLFARDI